MEKETEKVILKLEDRKKHSVRYDRKNSDVLKSVYLMNEAFKRLGEPKAISIVVTPADAGH